MTLLLDTNVISELRKVRLGRADPNVSRWAEEVEAGDLYLSVVSVLELEKGVLQLERRDPAQGRVLRSWFEGQVLREFAPRILAIDTAIARRCAQIHVPDPRSEGDALIAATGLVHSMTVVTRDTADFAGLGVSLLNPWLFEADHG